MRARQLLSTISMEDRVLKVQNVMNFLNLVNLRISQTDIISLPSSGYLLRIVNWPSNLKNEDVLGSIAQALEAGGVKLGELKFVEGAHTSAVLRFNEDNTDMEAVKAKLQNLDINQTKPNYAEIVMLRKPALFVRKLKEVSEASFKQLFANDTDVERIEWERASADLMNDLAVVYFSSEQAAFKSLQKLKGLSLDGQKLSVVFR